GCARQWPSSVSTKPKSSRWKTNSRTCKTRMSMIPATKTRTTARAICPAVQCLRWQADTGRPMSSQPLSAPQFEFRDHDFAQVRKMIYARAGIALGEHKREMVYSRLARRLRALRLRSFSQYLEQLLQAPASPEWEHFVNALTTNLTAFFREPHHFPILQRYAQGLGRPLSVWCAAASTGEEPYSIAMALTEASPLGAARSHVLATDINTE